MKFKGLFVGLGFISFFGMLYLKSLKRTHDLAISQDVYGLLVALFVILIIAGLLVIISPIFMSLFTTRKKKITK